jgi:hypothetical protein
MTVKKAVRIFSSFKEGEEADDLVAAQMTPEERLKITIELRDRRHPDAANQPMVRVCRIKKLHDE